MSRVLTIVLAGGKGERLQPLTEHRAKPAVPFGGIYRIIDFTLSNCFHSGLRQIMVLTQYKSQSLARHLRLAWGGDRRNRGEYIEIVPPQQRIDDRWYGGTADAVYHNVHAIEQSEADDVLVLSGDHVYAMDYRPLLEAHQRSEAATTVACAPVPLAEGSSFGVMGIDRDDLIVEFQEKPARPFPMPDDPQRCLASMGVYVFRKSFLLDHLIRNGGDINPRLDFGRHLLPRIIERRQARAYPFRDQATGRNAYWRDVGTVDAYYQSSRDLLKADSPIKLRDRSWPIHSHADSTRPTFLDFSDSGSRNVRHSLLGPGNLITDAFISGSILSSDVQVRDEAEVVDSILFDGVIVGPRACLRNTIVDKNVEIPQAAKIGFDGDWDRAHGFHVTASGITVVPKGFVFPRGRYADRIRSIAVARTSVAVPHV